MDFSSKTTYSVNGTWNMLTVSSAEGKTKKLPLMVSYGDLGSVD